MHEQCFVALWQKNLRLRAFVYEFWFGLDKYMEISTQKDPIVKKNDEYFKWIDWLIPHVKTVQSILPFLLTSLKAF